jgi:hypothetical protein
MVHLIEELLNSDSTSLNNLAKKMLKDVKKKKFFSCNICNSQFNEAGFDRHINTDKHKKNVDKFLRVKNEGYGLRRR